MEGWEWLNPPESFEFIGNNGVKVVTKDHSDFWQRTDGDFRHDNGHLLYKKVKGDFILTTEINFNHTTLYDHSGLCVRIDEDNWLKMGLEYHSSEISDCGAVVTNFGYSDWSKEEMPASVNHAFYKLQRKGNDFFVSVSLDGKNYREIRVAHLHKALPEIMAGIFACSPKRAGLECQFTNILIEQ